MHNNERGPFMVNDNHPLMPGDRLASMPGNAYFFGSDCGHDNTITALPFRSVRFCTDYSGPELVV
jgi:hypothetical protein